MKGNVKLIETLNSLLADELTAINHYMLHAEMCANWGYEKLHTSSEKRAAHLSAPASLRGTRTLNSHAWPAPSATIHGSATFSLELPMLLSLLYFAVRRLLHLLNPGDDDRAAREIEILVLRHQVRVLSRGRRLSLKRRDRVLLAAASRFLPRELWRCFSVSPQTVLR